MEIDNYIQASGPDSLAVAVSKVANKASTIRMSDSQRQWCVSYIPLIALRNVMQREPQSPVWFEYRLKREATAQNPIVQYGVLALTSLVLAKKPVSYVQSIAAKMRSLPSTIPNPLTTLLSRTMTPAPHTQWTFGPFEYAMPCATFSFEQFRSLASTTNGAAVLLVAPFAEEALKQELGIPFACAIGLFESLQSGNPYNLLFHALTEVVRQKFRDWGAPPLVQYLATTSLHVLNNYVAMQAGIVPAATITIGRAAAIAAASVAWSKFKRYLPDNPLLPPTPPQLPNSAVSVGPSRSKDKVDKPLQVCAGLADEANRPTWYASNQTNELESIRRRVTKQTPIANPNEAKKFAAWVKRNIRKILPKTFRNKPKPVAFATYLKRSNAAPGVKKIIAKARAKLEAEGIDEHTRLSKQQCRAWTVRGGFVKVEHNVHRNNHDIKVKVCRTIQSAQPEFIALVGPAIMALQDKIKRDLNRNNFACFTSGVSAADVAKVLTSIHGNIVENDVTAWDASYSEFLCVLEVQICQMLGLPKATIQLMRANINTRGVTTHGVRYKRRGMRKSGDPYTSLLNSLMNILLHCYIIHTQTKWSVAKMRRCVRLVVQGDDAVCVIAHTRFDFKTKLLALGFEGIAIWRNSYDRVEFCSMRLYPVHGGWCFGPKVGKVLAKAGFFLDPPMDVHPRTLVRGTALGLLPCASFIEPLRIYLERVLQLTGDADDRAGGREEW